MSPASDFAASTFLTTRPHISIQQRTKTLSPIFRLFSASSMIFLLKSISLCALTPVVNRHIVLVFTDSKTKEWVRVHFLIWTPQTFTVKEDVTNVLNLHTTNLTIPAKQRFLPTQTYCQVSDASALLRNFSPAEGDKERDYWFFKSWSPINSYWPPSLTPLYYLKGQLLHERVSVVRKS